MEDEYERIAGAFIDRCARANWCTRGCHYLPDCDTLIWGVSDGVFVAPVTPGFEVDLNRARFVPLGTVLWVAGYEGLGTEPAVQLPENATPAFELQNFPTPLFKCDGAIVVLFENHTVDLYEVASGKLRLAARAKPTGLPHTSAQKAKWFPTSRKMLVADGFIVLSCHGRIAAITLEGWRFKDSSYNEKIKKASGIYWCDPDEKVVPGKAKCARTRIHHKVGTAAGSQSLYWNIESNEVTHEVPPLYPFFGYRFVDSKEGVFIKKGELELAVPGVCSGTEVAGAVQHPQGGVFMFLDTDAVILITADDKIIPLLDVAHFADQFTGLNYDENTGDYYVLATSSCDEMAVLKLNVSHEPYFTVHYRPVDQMAPCVDFVKDGKSFILCGGMDHRRSGLCQVANRIRLNSSSTSESKWRFSRIFKLDNSKFLLTRPMLLEGASTSALLEKDSMGQLQPSVSSTNLDLSNPTLYCGGLENGWGVQVTDRSITIWPSGPLVQVESHRAFYVKYNDSHSVITTSLNSDSSVIRLYNVSEDAIECVETVNSAVDVMDIVERKDVLWAATNDGLYKLETNNLVSVALPGEALLAVIPVPHDTNDLLAISEGGLLYLFNTSTNTAEPGYKMTGGPLLKTEHVRDNVYLLTLSKKTVLLNVDPEGKDVHTWILESPALPSIKSMVCLDGEKCLWLEKGGELQYGELIVSNSAVQYVRSFNKDAKSSSVISCIELLDSGVYLVAMVPGHALSGELECEKEIDVKPRNSELVIVEFNGKSVNETVRLKLADGEIVESITKTAEDHQFLVCTKVKSEGGKVYILEVSVSHIKVLGCLPVKKDLVNAVLWDEKYLVVACGESLDLYHVVPSAKEEETARLVKSSELALEGSTLDFVHVSNYWGLSEITDITPFGEESLVLSTMYHDVSVITLQDDKTLRDISGRSNHLDSAVNTVGIIDDENLFLTSEERRRIAFHRYGLWKRDWEGIGLEGMYSLACTVNKFRSFKMGPLKWRSTDIAAVHWLDIEGNIGVVVPVKFAVDFEVLHRVESIVYEKANVPTSNYFWVSGLFLDILLARGPKFQEEVWHEYQRVTREELADEESSGEDEDHYRYNPYEYKPEPRSKFFAGRISSCEQLMTWLFAIREAY